MANQIDHDFVSDREGGSVTTGYVPAAQVSKSGVTVATGFDLGARNTDDLSALGLSPALKAKLTRYCGKKGKDAADALKTTPLTITPSQATEIDVAVRKSVVSKLQLAYRASPDNPKNVDLFDLPAEAQTVIASVSFQYGDLAFRAPKFWKAVSSQDWRTAVSILRDFGDAYPSRRNLEADLLQRIVK
jgi:hypothetical protein